MSGWVRRQQTEILQIKKIYSRVLSSQSNQYLHVAFNDIFPDGRIVDIGVNDGEKIMNHCHRTQKLEEKAEVNKFFLPL